VTEIDPNSSSDPAPQPRDRFTRVSDWHNFLRRRTEAKQSVELYPLRTACYKDIEALRERPILIYATKFVSNEVTGPVSIEMTDIDGFVDLANSVQSDAVDVLLHSPGGSPEATERIVDILRHSFKDVTFLIPHSAYSAATMLALSGNRIILHPAATLGPIDPQINGVPARSIRRGFDNIREILKEEGPEALPAYMPLISQLSLHVLELCDDAADLSEALVRGWLQSYMFEGDESKKDAIEKAVKFFSNYDEHKTHSRPLNFAKVRNFGLNIEVANPSLQLLLREAWILIDAFFKHTSFVKLYENAEGLSWGMQFIAAGVPIPVAASEDPALPV